MSRFFSQTGGDSDSSSSSEDEDSEKSEEEEEQAPAPAAKPVAAKTNAFMKGDADSDSDDEGKRVVRSHKDKKWDQMTSCVEKMKNDMKINDWNAISADFDLLHKLMDKAKQIIAKEGVPQFYYKALLNLDAFLQKTLADKPAIKKMSKTNAKSLNSMKQNLRKKMEERKAAFDAARKAMPIGGGDSDSESESESEEETTDDDSEEDAPAGKAAFMKKPAAGKPEAAAPAKGKGAAKKEDPKPIAKKEEPKGPKPIKDYNEAEIDDRLNLVLSLRGRKGTNKEDQISVLSQLSDVTKRPSKLVELLSHVIAFTFDLNNSMLSAMPVPTWHAVMGYFKRILKTLVENPDLKVEIVEASTTVDTTQLSKVEMEEGGDPDEDFIDTGVTQMSGNVLAYLERLDDEFYKSLQALDPHQQEYIARLKDEVPLVNLMLDTLAYYDSKEAPIDAARVSARVVEHVYYREQQLFDTAQSNAVKRKAKLLEELEAAAEKAKAAELKAVAAEEVAAELEEEEEEEESDDDDGPKEKPKLPERVAADEDKAAFLAAKAAHDGFVVPRQMALGETMDTCAKRVYGHGTERHKTRTLLCHVYHHALHGRYQLARDKLLTSHLADTVHQFDISTQILYNRAIVRCGLCAFHNELMPEAHSALMEIAAGARLKELLAQGLSSTRYGERSAEQEKAERRRLVPYHMHINLELVEAVHLISAMLLELPNLAHNSFDPKRRQASTSKAFRRLLDHFERQVFNGPPENIRDSVMSCVQLLIHGEWTKALASVDSLPVWNLLPSPQETKAFMKKQIQREGLRAFLIAHYAHYDSISLEKLAERFELPKDEAHAVVSKMLLAGELHACWDQPTECITVQHMEPSKLQFLALQFADKTAQLVETNERVLDSRTGSYGYKADNWQDRRDGYTRRPPAVLASVRGVPKAEWAIYTADTFECKDGSAKLPVSQVNDDYCDCADGSDEPGTSACPNAIFFCANKGYKSKIVFSSLVNDGVCDCCDGSDEWAMGPDACKNECLELGAVAKAEAEERAKLVKSGYEIATQWAARGEESQKTTQAELDALMLEIEAKKKELAEIDERKAAAEEVEKTLQEEHRLKKEAERLEKEAEAEEQRLKEEEEKAAAAKEAAEKAPAPELDPAPSAEGDDKASAAQAQALEALGCTPLTTANCEQEDYKPVCASTKQGEEWTRRTFHSACHARAAGFSGVCFRFLTTGSCDEAPYPDLPAAEEAGEPSEDDFKAAETETEGDETAGEVEEEPEAAAEPEEPLPTDPGVGGEDEPSPRQQEAAGSTISWFRSQMRRLGGWLASWVRSKSRAPVSDYVYPEAEKLRGEHSDKQSEIDKLQDRQRELKDSLEKDFGPQRRFEPLQHECFEIPHGEWIYEVCPFKKATQKGKHGGGGTDLGRWERFSNDYKTMEFKHGQACWNGPIRSMTVSVSCGGANKLTKVDEPEMCTYVASFETPAACTEEDARLAQQEVETCSADLEE